MSASMPTSNNQPVFEGCMSVDIQVGAISSPWPPISSRSPIASRHLIEASENLPERLSPGADLSTPRTRALLPGASGACRHPSSVNSPPPRSARWEACAKSGMVRCNRRLAFIKFFLSAAHRAGDAAIDRGEEIVGSGLSHRGGLRLDKAIDEPPHRRNTLLHRDEVSLSDLLDGQSAIGMERKFSLKRVPGIRYLAHLEIFKGTPLYQSYMV